MAVPIGQKLREMRLARGLSLEDVQHRTRISRNLLVAMENDDLSAFPNQTYARKFFAAYARHLGVEVSAFLNLLQPHGLGGVIEFHPYLQMPADRTGPKRPGPATLPSLRHSVVLVAGLTALALAAGTAVWTGLHLRQHPAPENSLTGDSRATPRTPAPDRSAPPAPPSPIEPPKLPVLRATPVDEKESSTQDAQARAASSASLPLIESLRQSSPAPPPR